MFLFSFFVLNELFPFLLLLVVFLLNSFFLISLKLFYFISASLQLNNWKNWKTRRKTQKNIFFLHSFLCRFYRNLIGRKKRVTRLDYEMIMLESTKQTVEKNVQHSYFLLHYSNERTKRTRKIFFFESLLNFCKFSIFFSL